MKVKTILNIGVVGTFATVVGSILLIVIRGTDTGFRDGSPGHGPGAVSSR